MKIPDKRSTIFCRKGYTVDQVVDDIHTWYDPFCSLSWYGNENLRLITEIEEVQSLGISVHFPVNLQVIDPQGRQTGFDPEKGEIVNEIPEAVSFHNIALYIKIDKMPI